MNEETKVRLNAPDLEKVTGGEMFPQIERRGVPCPKCGGDVPVLEYGVVSKTLECPHCGCEFPKPTIGWNS